MRTALVLCLVVGCTSHTRWADAVEAREPSARRITVTATRHGFVPNELHARAGETLTLEFTRTDTNTCVERVVVYLAEHRQLERDLPLNQPVAVTLRVPHAGEVGVSCAMKMFGATLRVDP